MGGKTKKIRKWYNNPHTPKNTHPNAGAQTPEAGVVVEAGVDVVDLLAGGCTAATLSGPLEEQVSVEFA